MNDEISSPGKENMLKQLCNGMDQTTLKKVDPAKLRLEEELDLQKLPLQQDHEMMIEKWKNTKRLNITSDE